MTTSCMRVSRQGLLLSDFHLRFPVYYLFDVCYTASITRQTLQKYALFSTPCLTDNGNVCLSVTVYRSCVTPGILVL